MDRDPGACGLRTPVRPRRRLGLDTAATPTGNRIKVNTNKSFRLPNGQEGPGPIDVVIVDFAAAHYYYTSPWQENNPVPPVCFAINFDANTLVPSPNSPEKQAEGGAVCPQNQFESAPNGKGKACRNTRQLAVLPLDATEDTPIWLLSLSPTALQPFDKFVTAMARKYNGPPMKIVTRIGFDPTVTYASLRFAEAGPGLGAAAAFLAVDLVMDALGYQVGAPGAAERATMLTVMMAGYLSASLAGGAALGFILSGYSSNLTSPSEI